MKEKFDDSLLDSIKKDTVHNLGEKIRSNFKFLMRYQTSKEELEILDVAIFKVKTSEDDFDIDGFHKYEIQVGIPYFHHDRFLELIPDIQKNLEEKVKIILNWFPSNSKISIKIIGLSI